VRIKRLFKVYNPFARGGVQESMIYRVDFMFILLGCISGGMVSFFIWRAVFASSEQATFLGFSEIEMMTYIFISFLIGFLTHTEAANVIGNEIRDGSIAMRIIKPLDFNLPFLFQEVGAQTFVFSVTFFPILIALEIYRAFVSGSVQFDPVCFLLFCVSGMMAYLINFHFNICFGFTAFVFKNLWGANTLKDCIVRFLSGEVIPLAFLPLLLGRVLNFLPFAGLCYIPVMIYMGRYTGWQAAFYMGLQLFWLLFFVLMSKIIWRVMIKRLCVQGG